MCVLKQTSSILGMKRFHHQHFICDIKTLTCKERIHRHKNGSYPQVQLQLIQLNVNKILHTAVIVNKLQHLQMKVKTFGAVTRADWG